MFLPILLMEDYQTFTGFSVAQKDIYLRLKHNSLIQILKLQRPLQMEILNLSKNLRQNLTIPQLDLLSIKT